MFDGGSRGAGALLVKKLEMVRCFCFSAELEEEGEEVRGIAGERWP